MSPFSHYVPALLCASTLLAGQPPAVPPAPSAHSHTPPPSSHGPGVVVLDQFVTSAAPFPRNQADLAQSTTVLGGHSLLLKQQPTLGETLAAETGMHATSFGPGASRPIIRGLGGDRIRVLENSIGTQDASVISPDHAVSAEPFLIERIEVVRGPASLLYGSNAAGGVVNVITHRIETEFPDERLRGAAELRGGTASHEVAGGGVLDVALKTSADGGLVVHLDGFRRRTDDLRIPGFAESDALRVAERAHAEEHGEPAPSFAHGTLPNSFLESRSAAGGVSYVTPTFHFGFSHAGFDTNYGVPGHGHDAEAGAPGVRIDLRQRRTDAQGEWHGDDGFITGARIRYGRARYRHVEIDPEGDIGTVFTNDGHEGRVELLHGAAGPWTGAIGAQFMRSDLTAEGEEAFLPSSRSESAAVFAFEEIEAGRLTWQFGGRYERTRIARAGAPRRQDSEGAASIGALWKWDEAHVLAVSIAHTGRAPNPQELFARGPHAGTRSFELGDAALRAERSLGIEASLRRRQGAITGAATLFAHRFRGYIFEEPTGLLATEESDGWAFVPAGSEAPDHEALPVYRYAQRDARFWGAELEAVWHLHESTRWNLDVRLAADFTRAQESGRNLPRIPAARTTAGVAWNAGGWSAGAECQRVHDQGRVAANERATDGYVLVSAHIARGFEIDHAHVELFLRGSNLADVEARPHPSFVKDFAPLAGRAVTAGVRLAF